MCCCGYYLRKKSPRNGHFGRIFKIVESTDIQDKGQGIPQARDAAGQPGLADDEMCEQVTCLTAKTTILSIQISAMELILMTHSAKSGISRMLLLVIGLLGATAPLQQLAAKDVYKWVNDAGEVQYTQFPPPQGTEAVEVKPPPPPADNPAAINSDLDEQVEAMDERTQDREISAKKSSLEAEIERVSRQNCEIARKNLAELQQGGIKRYQTGDGKVIRLTEEDRQRRIAEANDQIQEFCK